MPDFCTKAPVRGNKAKLVDIVVARADSHDIQFWDSEMVPRNIKHSPGRADVKWKWQNILALAATQDAQGRPYEFYAISTPNSEGEWIRAAMMMIICPHPHIAPNSDDGSAFVWFLAAAETKSLTDEKIKVSEPPSLGRVMIDTAIVHSLGCGYAGRIGLHAAPAGGPELLSFYADHCQLDRVPKTSRLPLMVSTALKGNDGRYFYADASLAMPLLNEVTQLGWR